MNKFIFNNSFLVLLISMLLSGCISITKELPFKKTYTLSIENRILKNKYYDKTIRIYEPKALSSINTREIIYSKNLVEQEKYALNNWSDKPSKMLQKIMSKYLTLQNSYKYITSSNIKVNNDYNIISELVEFKQIFSKTKSYANFSIRVYLINNKTKKVYFKNFSYKKLSKTNDANGLVYAINYTSNLFLFDLQTFIQESLKKDLI
ncbi:MAG: hypothetical protein GY932_09865 [Arcobacter sp.]|nr:hypothetical protein [Arcobacter sp.]